MESSQDDIVVKNLSWWERRTTTEKRLVIALGISLLCTTVIVFLYVTSLKNKGDKLQNELDSEEESNLCLTPGCIHTSSEIIDYMDATADPCDNFYQFACGGYLQKNNIPDDENVISPVQTIQISVLDNLKNIFEEPINPKELKPLKFMKKLYNMCMNTEAIESDEYDTLIYSILKPLGGWPVLEQKYWNENVFDWKNITHQLRKMGIPNAWFLNVYVSDDTRDSAKGQIFLTQPVLAVAADELVKGFASKTVQSYYEYMVDVAVLLGVEINYARKELKSALEFNVELGKLTSETEDDTRLTVAELQQRYPSTNWLIFLNNIINLPEVKFKENEVVVVSNIHLIENLLDLLNRTSKRVQANYVLFQVIEYLVPYLTEEIRDRQRQFNKNIYAAETKLSRWSECVFTVIIEFPKEIGALYVDNYFDKEIKGDIEEIVADIRAELNKTIEDIEWMEESIKEKSLRRVNSLEFRIAYSDGNFNRKTMEKYYSKLTITSGNYLLSALNLQKFTNDQSFLMLRKPVKDRLEDIPYILPVLCDIAYNPTRNRIEYPPTVLQGIFFDMERPNYMNYGSIGYLLGHEIFHTIDNSQGTNKKENMEGSWPEDTEKAFNEKVKCFTDQYRAITEPITKSKLNVENTQREDLADNAGIQLAYHAYQAWVERNGEESLLPGLNYTQNQMFWISAASARCEKIQKEALLEKIEKDPSSPATFRVMIPFANTESFGEDFNCELGTKMNPKEKCQIF